MAVNHATSVIKEKKRRDAKGFSKFDNLRTSEVDRRRLLESVRARDSLRR
jgi:hypothetical protein